MKRIASARGPDISPRPAASAEPPKRESDSRDGGIGSDLFREEAVREYARGSREGDIVRISPRWAVWTFRTLVATVLGGVTFALVAKIDEYAAGPAVVRATGHVDLSARAAGTVEEVLARPGSTVQEGQVLVRLYAGAEQSELERIQTEFDLQLVRLLRDPSDDAARRALAPIRSQRILAEARVEKRIIRAPRAGVVSDVRIRPGQPLSAGDRILSLVGEDTEMMLVALLPGRYRPLLEPGMPLRLEVTGYSHAYVDLEVNEIGEQVIGPEAVRRYLGPEVGDAIGVAGPTVLVTANLPGGTFRSDGRDHDLFAGMHGVAELRVRRESLLVAIVPGLRALVEGARD